MLVNWRDLIFELMLYYLYTVRIFLNDNNKKTFGHRKHAIHIWGGGAWEMIELNPLCKVLQIVSTVLISLEILSDLDICC